MTSSQKLNYVVANPGQTFRSRAEPLPSRLSYNSTGTRLPRMFAHWNQNETRSKTTKMWTVNSWKKRSSRSRLSGNSSIAHGWIITSKGIETSKNSSHSRQQPGSPPGPKSRHRSRPPRSCSHRCRRPLLLKSPTWCSSSRTRPPQLSSLALNGSRSRSGTQELSTETLLMPLSNWKYSWWPRLQSQARRKYNTAPSNSVMTVYYCQKCSIYVSKNSSGKYSLRFFSKLSEHVN